MGKQNTSHAVMAQRFEAKDSLDDFPTPPWATRALLEHVIVTKNAPTIRRGSLHVAKATWQKSSKNISAN